MSPEFIALIIGFITLLLSQIGVFMQLNARIDRLDEKVNDKIDKLEDKIDKLDTKLEDNTNELESKIDKVRDELKLEMRDLSSRIDTVNSRLDNLYHELFKRDVA